MQKRKLAYVAGLVCIVILLVWAVPINLGGVSHEGKVQFFIEGIASDDTTDYDAAGRSLSENQNQ